MLLFFLFLRRNTVKFVRVSVCCFEHLFCSCCLESLSLFVDCSSRFNCIRLFHAVSIVISFISLLNIATAFFSDDDVINAYERMMLM